MILGFATVEDNAVITHRDSFMLSSVSVVSVRRPYLAGAVLLSTGLLGFTGAFYDLLYPQELAVIIGSTITLLLAGTQIAQLSLLSRDLRGTELSSAVWGTPGSLQRIRRQIVQTRQAAHSITTGE